ncbi:MAG: 4-hydroxy-tetrahydrodipicolinate reductase, partial [Bacteroidales bacterium]|nr:4-hydroxy-tetrahydrodipicolinate reductase [Bacteroidales bacterium]
MNIALIGYGKMGRTIEALGIQQGLSFPVIIDEHNRAHLSAGKLDGIDAAIEFSTPAAAPENIMKCIDIGVPVVTGTTGWNHRIPEIEAYCMEKNGTLFYASNFSIGVNILFALNRKLAEIMDQFPEYAIS